MEKEDARKQTRKALHERRKQVIRMHLKRMPVTFAVGGTRQKLSMIATVINQGKTRWMMIDEAKKVFLDSR